MNFVVEHSGIETCSSDLLCLQASDTPLSKLVNLGRTSQGSQVDPSAPLVSAPLSTSKHA